MRISLTTRMEDSPYVDHVDIGERRRAIAYDLASRLALRILTEFPPEWEAQQGGETCTIRLDVYRDGQVGEYIATAVQNMYVKATAEGRKAAAKEIERKLIDHMRTLTNVT